MNDKVALVTGANGGLGKHVTQAFLQAGATVVGTAPRLEAATLPHGKFTAIAAEISRLQAARNLVEQVVARFGRIDVLAHTIGGFAGGAPVAETDDATFQKMMDMNLNVTFHVLRAVIPAMRKNGWGRIVAIGSRAALEPGANVGAYSASKAALVSLIRTVAEENKDAGITANAILPGTIDTPANRQAMPKADFSQWVRPEKIADLMVFLAGDSGSEITGAAIPVYGRG